MNIYVYEYIYFSFASICLLPALGYYINNRNFSLLTLTITITITFTITFEITFTCIWESLN